MVTISSISHAACQESKASGSPIRLSALQQLVAAALGYKSLAAYQASPLEPQTLDEAKHFVLDVPLLKYRAHQLGIAHPIEDLVSLVELGIKSGIRFAKFYKSTNSLFDYVTNYVDQHTLNDDKVSSEMASTNSNGIDEIYIPIDDFELSSLPPPGDALKSTIEGHIAMGIDTERPYSGHRIDVSVTLVLERISKVSMADVVCEVEKANLDYSWGD